MLISKADLIRYFVIEEGMTGDLVEAFFKRRFPKFWASFGTEGIEIDETQPKNREFCALVKKWKDWHDGLGAPPRGTNQTG